MPTRLLKVTFLSDYCGLDKKVLLQVKPGDAVTISQAKYAQLKRDFPALVRVGMSIKNAGKLTK
jgi:hypothetical protein